MSNLKEEPYGFRYGPMRVVRLHRTDDTGAWIEVCSEREVVQVRVTRTGFIRVGKPVKDGGAMWRAFDA